MSPRATSPRSPRSSLLDHRALAQFRYEIRKFLRFSENAARQNEIEPQQHQLLLAVAGLPPGSRPTIATIADRLCVEHQTTVALVDKLQDRGFVERERSEEDRREVLIRLMPEGRDILRKLSEIHREQLLTAGPQMVRALGSILQSRGPPPKTDEGASPSSPTSSPQPVDGRRSRADAASPILAGERTMPRASENCLTCYGAGETVTENGPQTCPDCFGGGSSLSHSTKFEWRLREIERIYRHSGRETEADVLWLVHEVRKGREALVSILARCQDADDDDAMARDVKFQANEALGIYEPS